MFTSPTIKDVQESYIIANVYNFCPGRVVGACRPGTSAGGKYEPDLHPGAEERVMLFANWTDKTNVLIKYRPDELIKPE
jgi:hypothetical protein